MQKEKKELRDYQETLSLQARVALGKYRKVLLQLDTGGGKTVIAKDIIERAVLAGKRVAFVTDRKKILTQTIKTLNDDGISCESFESTSSVIYVSKVYVCMAETFFRRLSSGWFKDIKIDLLVVDEAHGGVFTKIVEMFPDEYVLGMTATPISTGTVQLNKIYNNIITGPSKTELLEKGYLVPAVNVGHNQMLELMKQAGEFTPASQILQFSQNRIDDRFLKLWQYHSSDKKTIVFNINVEHNKKVVQLFKDNGISCEGIDAKAKDRDAIEKDFERGNIQVLMNVGIHTKGSDYPFVECIGMNHSTMSLSKYMQEAGRGGRICPAINKKNFIFIDMGNNYFRHGSYNDDIDWLSLFNNPDLDSTDAIKKKSKICPVCFAYVDNIYIPNCPVCECSFSTNKLLSLESLMPKKLVGKDLNSMTFNELKEYAKYKGYKPNFAYMQRYGGRKKY